MRLVQHTPELLESQSDTQVYTPTSHILSQGLPSKPVHIGKYKQTTPIPAGNWSKQRYSSHVLRHSLQITYSSRDGAVFRLSIQYYLIHQHHVRQTRRKWRRTAPSISREQHDVHVYEHRTCNVVAEKLHIPVMSSSWPQSGVGGVHKVKRGNLEHQL